MEKDLIRHSLRLRHLPQRGRQQGDDLIRHGFAVPPSPEGKASGRRNGAPTNAPSVSFADSSPCAGEPGGRWGSAPTCGKAGSVQELSKGQALIKAAAAFYDTQDAEEMMRYKGEALYCYKSTVSDAALGFIPSAGKYDFGAVFYRPAAFDESIFRDAAMYAMTTEPNGTLDYNAAASRPVMLNISKDYKMQVTFTSGVQMHGASLSQVNALPRFRLVFVYFGLAEPKDVNTIIFTVDDRLYQFTLPANYISSSYDPGKGLYRYQGSIVIGRNGSALMNALVSTGREVQVEVRGTGFNIRFPLIAKAIAPLVEDWNNFKRAGGASALYRLAADETPVTVY